MSGFSAEWLALREPADLAARSTDVAEAVSARLSRRERVEVVDLGCGSGSNLRGTAPLLPLKQSWRLVDNDVDLLSAARQALIEWADTFNEVDGGGLSLTSDGRSIEVTFQKADLATDLELILGPAPDLVTAAAFFDLASPQFIARVAKVVVEREAMLLTVLTYNGIQHWQPRNPLDSRITAAFNRHQMSDKGLGPSAGPTAPAHLADQFRLGGYGVIEGDSPWILRGPADQSLIDELIAGQAAAVAETRALTAVEVERWHALKRDGALVGHTDTFAFPV